MSTKIKPYYSFLHKREENIQEDTFYKSSDYTWTIEIEENWKVIYSEIINYINQDATVLKPFYSTEMVNAPNKWKSFNFSFWGIEFSKKACQACPKTIKLLKQIPDIVSASISVLEANAQINQHRGETDAIYRCHLGLIIPAALPTCGMEVGAEKKTWEEGKLLIFNDAANHRAWNNTNEKRVVMIIDVIKPEYSSQKKHICAKVFGSIIFQTFNSKMHVFKNKRSSLVRLIYGLNTYIVLLYFVFCRKKTWLY